MSNSFNILNNAVEEILEVNKELELTEQIKSLLNSSKIVVFMKGNADMPMCGFSANTTAILKQLGVSFKTFNILNDEEIRQGLKEYSNWPTYPQVYVNGKLIGGNDIVTEMYQSGELQEYLANN
ncbi:MAG TPA: Grx4 family monothiol glutaredoxin [Bacteriovoracaceae bacterium]|nr:Grx4 family monothiol glutaredoxin [Bacteriovoracaceae bacterium]